MFFHVSRLLAKFKLRVLETFSYRILGMDQLHHFVYGLPLATEQSTPKYNQGSCDVICTLLDWYPNLYPKVGYKVSLPWGRTDSCCAPYASSETTSIG